MSVIALLGPLHAATPMPEVHQGVTFCNGLAHHPLQAIRAVFRLITGAAMIPLLVNIARPLDCSGEWLSTGIQCGSGAHLGLVAASVTLFLVTSIMLIGRASDSLLSWHRDYSCSHSDVMFGTVCVSRHPTCTDQVCVHDSNGRSDNLASRAHGRAHMWMLLARVIMVLVYAIAQASNAAALLAVLWTVSVAMIYAIVTLQPFLHRVVNYYFAAFTFLFAWATFCTTMLQLRGHPEVMMMLPAAMLLSTLHAHSPVHTES